MNFGARYRHLPYRVAFELVLKRSRAEFGGIIAKYLPGVKRIETEGRICLELKDETNTKKRDSNFAMGSEISFNRHYDSEHLYSK